MDYPPDPVLVARGKYATLGSDKRKRMKELRDRMQAITDQARLILRFDEDASNAAATYDAMKRQTELTGECLAHLAELQTQMDALKPEAWGKKESHDE